MFVIQKCPQKVIDKWIDRQLVSSGVTQRGNEWIQKHRKTLWPEVVVSSRVTQRVDKHLFRQRKTLSTDLVMICVNYCCLICYSKSGSDTKRCPNSGRELYMRHKHVLIQLSTELGTK
ncbi:unnamed protein product [Medioppia subpectinata]|uniref:Uncharacterized protein n=1 Tax=Medioppia subpectinata TaxID=1979941 RepID=A0A7R9KC11_9ACAR|nr:unnamed protein product [Medioppia subpectinata]CAG2100694.1 unnamed protein product [Medioppia subpectinata]